MNLLDELKGGTQLYVDSRRNIMGNIKFYYISKDQEKKERIAKITRTTHLFVQFVHTFMSNTFLPFSFTITDADKNMLGYIEKPADPRQTRITVYDENRQPIGNIRMQLGIRKYMFELLSMDSKQIAVVSSGSIGRNFTIVPSRGELDGKVTVKPQAIIAKIFVPYVEYDVQLPKYQGSRQNKLALTILTLVLPLLVTEINS